MVTWRGGVWDPIFAVGFGNYGEHLVLHQDPIVSNKLIFCFVVGIEEKSKHGHFGGYWCWGFISLFLSPFFFLFFLTRIISLSIESLIQNISTTCYTPHFYFESAAVIMSLPSPPLTFFSFRFFFFFDTGNISFEHWNPAAKHFHHLSHSPPLFRKCSSDREFSVGGKIFGEKSKFGGNRSDS